MYSDVVRIIKGLYPMYSGSIPLHAPVFRGNEKKYLNECIDTTFVSSVGKFVTKFEEMIADFTGAKYAVAAVNGTAALHIALKLVGVETGDLIITQSLTFVATANAISYCGAEPVFLDVDRDTLGLSPIAVKRFIETQTYTKNSICFHKSTGKRIKACVPMHTFGHPCRIDELKEICSAYNIELVEDAAESLGSYYIGKHTGTFGSIGILSFNGNKTITTGGGGMLITDNEELAKQAKHLTTTAKVQHPWEFIHDEIGYNYRLTNLAAALGCAQMEQLHSFLKAKREIASIYKEYFISTPIDFISEPADSVSNYWLNAILLQNKKERDEFLNYTNENGVMTRPIWQLMNRLPAFKNCITDNLENAFWLEERVVNIPSSVI